MTLTMTFHLLLKNFNIVFNWCTVKDRAFIFEELFSKTAVGCTASYFLASSDKYMYVRGANVIVLPLGVGGVDKNFNLGHIITF